MVNTNSDAAAATCWNITNKRYAVELGGRMEARYSWILYTLCIFLLQLEAHTHPTLHSPTTHTQKHQNQQHHNTPLHATPATTASPDPQQTLPLLRIPILPLSGCCCCCCPVACPCCTGTRCPVEIVHPGGVLRSGTRSRSCAQARTRAGSARAATPTTPALRGGSRSTSSG